MHRVPPYTIVEDYFVRHYKRELCCCRTGNRSRPFPRTRYTSRYDEGILLSSRHLVMQQQDPLPPTRVKSGVLFCKQLISLVPFSEGGLRDTHRDWIKGNHRINTYTVGAIIFQREKTKKKRRKSFVFLLLLKSS